MNGSNLLVDTNILIYLLDKDAALVPLLDGKSIYISFISELEILSFKNYSAAEKSKLERLLNDCIIIDINPEIKRLAVRHRITKKLKLPDAVIAAPSQYLSFPLLTADQEFKKLSDIDVLIYERN
jgi:predicted nucleic acid-binding protein